MRPLCGCERLRQLHVRSGVQVALFGRPTRGWQAVTLQAEHLPLLRCWRNLQPQRLADERRDLDLTAEDGRRQGYVHARVEIPAFPIEARVSGQPNPQIQVAALCTAGAAFAFPGHTNARTAAHPRWNPNLHRPPLSVLL